VPASRIVLVDLGPDLTSLVRTATARTRDLMVVGEETEEVQVLMHAAKADVVIIGRAGEAAAAMAERLIDENSAVAVITVDATVERGRIYRQRLCVEDVAFVSAADLVEMARRIRSETGRWTPETPARASIHKGRES
jgi:hypothetical protein